MSIQAIYRCSYILIFSLLILGNTNYVHAQTADTVAVDSTDEEPAKKKIQPISHQLCIGADILHPVLNYYSDNKASYFFEAHYYLKSEFYGVLEGGWGSSSVNYPDLQYNTKNSFVCLGFNKSILTRESPEDWDMMFMGMRLGYANVNRSEGSYMVTDSLWGSSVGVSPAKTFPAVWAELTGGMRVELLKGFLAGWNMRGKFLLNGRSFKDLAPLNIAGYGRGDKNAAFDFNVYVSYAIRWHKAVPVKAGAVSKPQGQESR